MLAERARNAHLCGAGLPNEDLELRTFTNGRYLGRFMMRPNPGARPSQRSRLVAVTLADLAGHSLGAPTVVATPAAT